MKSGRLWLRHILELKKRYRFLVIFWDFFLFPFIFLNLLILAAALNRCVMGGMKLEDMKKVPDFYFDPVYWFKKLSIQFR